MAQGASNGIWAKLKIEREKFKDKKMKEKKSEIRQDIKKRVYRYALDVIQFVDRLPKSDLTCRVIGNQLLRSATSVGANIVEAQAASSKKDFTNFLNHSLKSANESKFWLGLLKDSGKATGNSIEQLLNETEELSKILGASIVTLRGTRSVF